jgi:dual specificity tyrosine-phosphorylation-regulated kinase 2/3/4
VLSELFSGYPLYPGENEKEQIGYIMEICGVPGIDVLEQGARSHLFFNVDGSPIIYTNTRGKKRLPNTKSLRKVLGSNSKLFLDFLKK